MNFGIIFKASPKMLQKDVQQYYVYYQKTLMELLHDIEMTALNEYSLY